MRRVGAQIKAFRFTRNVVDRIIGVVGELLMTAGVFVLLFLGWHVWYNDVVAGLAQDSAGSELSNEWTVSEISTVEFDRAVGSSDGVFTAAKPPVVEVGKPASRFASLLVPRFGPTFNRAIAVGVDRETVLNIRNAGIGYYPQTQRLGQVGNFAVAAHRITFGAPFADIEKLRLGDRIYVETPDGWYVYRFRNLEYVWPNNTRVLQPVPESNAKAKDRILTMTSCHPVLTSVERIIAYSTYESFIPRENGAPAEVAAIEDGR
ncbi:MAG: hypothetical protein RLZ72_904 [Actinomycetota bacterium]|jgi:sortase A